MQMSFCNVFLQVRHYDSAKWVTAEAESHFMELAISRAFRKLFKYITGENESGEFIAGYKICPFQKWILLAYMYNTL